MPTFRRACLLAALVAALWVPIALSTGGVRFRVAGIRISAHSVTNPIVVTAIGIVAAWALAPAGAKRRTLAADLRVVLGVRMLAAAARAARRLASWLPPMVGGAAAVAVIA